MGVPQFLKYVLPASRPFDWGYYKNGHGPTRRRLRVALDISTMIYTASQGHSTMLGDEDHLSNYGRAQLLEKGSAEKDDQILRYVTTCTKYVMDRLQRLQQKSNVEILVVFDGPHPPIKKKEVRQRREKRQEQEAARDNPAIDTTEEQTEIRLKANRRAGAGPHFREIVKHIQLALEAMDIAFMEAPYEADPQLAYLANRGYIDVICTEDSDLLAYATPCPVVYKLLDHLKDDKKECRLIRHVDLECIESLVDFTPTMLAVVFSLCGCDYCESLQGIGVATALKIVKAAFWPDRKTEEETTILQRVLNGAYKETWQKDLTKNFKESFEEAFLASVATFRHSIVYDPVLEKSIRLHDLNADSDLLELDAYRELVEDRLEEYTGPVVAPKVAGQKRSLPASETSEALQKQLRQEERKEPSPEEDEEDELADDSQMLFETQPDM